MTSTSTDSVHQELVALNADIVGYSKLLADDLDTTTSTMEEYHHLVEDKINANDGTLVNFVGDNFMSVFEKATDAMATSIGITAAIEERNAELPPHRQIRFRMGLDQGSITVAENQYFGDALNIAARIQSIAPPGGVSVSGRVYEALDEPSLRFHSMGLQDLKNIPEEVSVYNFADLPSDGQHATGRSLSLEAPTVAVLPIHTEMVDKTVLPAAEVIRSDLVHRIAAIPNLNVIDGADGEKAKTSASYFLETGVVQLGDQVRVFAKLVDVSTWNVATSHKWTASLADLFALSDEISEDVARAMEIELVIGEPARIYADIADPETLQTIYNAWFELSSGTREGWSHALEAFESVAVKHPDQPFGHVLAALTKWIGVGERYLKDRQTALEEAWEHAQLGIRAGDPTGLGQTVEAAILMSQGLPDQALEKIDGVEIIRPTCDITYAVEGSVRRYLGQWERAVDLTDTAMRLTAVNKPWYPTIQACSLYMGGKLEQAASTAEAVIEYQPNNLEALLVLAAAQQEMGLERRAVATAEIIQERYPAMDIGQWLEGNPYQDAEMVDRWRQNLVAAGVIDSA